MERDRGSRRVAVGFVFAAAALTGACLPAFAPNIRPLRSHAGVDTDAGRETCMGCHVAERVALERALVADAPLVADWMVADPRVCTDCHRLRGAR